MIVHDISFCLYEQGCWYDQCSRCNSMCFVCMSRAAGMTNVLGAIGVQAKVVGDEDSQK